jgi:serine protease
MASIGRNVMILPVRVLGKCGGYDSDIQQAMLWAAGLSSNPVPNPHPARVLNLSLGSPGTCPQSYQSVLAELAAANVTVVASAGNDGLAVDAPANCNGVIAVGGVRHIGTKVGYSSLGPQVAISAPAGNCVNVDAFEPCLHPLLTTTNIGTTRPVSNSFSDEESASVGTSFSAPLVAGTAALMLSVNSTLTPNDIKSGLQSTARSFPSSGADVGVPICHAPNNFEQLECYCTTSTCGAGLLDAAAAVASVASAQAPHVPLSASTANPTVGTPVVLEASDATVGSGRTGIYQWAITAGGALAAFSGATDSSTATLIPIGAGEVTATLTITDDLGVSRSASTTMVVSAVPSAAISPAPAGVESGQSAILSAATSSASGGRSIMQYQWSLLSGSSVLSLIGNTTGGSVTVHGTTPGNAVVALTITDSSGVTASTTVNVSVTPPAADSGGGALGLPWLLLLGGGVLAVAAARRRDG